MARQDGRRSLVLDRLRGNEDDISTIPESLFDQEAIYQEVERQVRAQLQAQAQRDADLIDLGMQDQAPGEESIVAKTRKAFHKVMGRLKEEVRVALRPQVGQREFDGLVDEVYQEIVAHDAARLREAVKEISKENTPPNMGDLRMTSPSKITIHGSAAFHGNSRVATVLNDDERTNGGSFIKWTHKAQYLKEEEMDQVIQGLMEIKANRALEKIEKRTEALGLGMPASPKRASHGMKKRLDFSSVDQYEQPQFVSTVQRPLRDEEEEEVYQVPSRTGTRNSRAGSYGAPQARAFPAADLSRPPPPFNTPTLRAATPRRTSTLLTTETEWEGDGTDFQLPRLGNRDILDKQLQEALTLKLKRCKPVSKIGGSEDVKEESRYALNALSKAITNGRLNNEAGFELLTQSVFIGDVRRYIEDERRAGSSVVHVFATLHKRCSEDLDTSEVAKQIDALLAAEPMKGSAEDTISTLQQLAHRLHRKEPVHLRRELVNRTVESGAKTMLQRFYPERLIFFAKELEDQVALSQERWASIAATSNIPLQQTQDTAGICFDIVKRLTQDISPKSKLGVPRRKQVNAINYGSPLQGVDDFLIPGDQLAYEIDHQLLDQEPGREEHPGAVCVVGQQRQQARWTQQGPGGQRTQEPGLVRAKCIKCNNVHAHPQGMQAYQFCARYGEAPEVLKGAKPTNPSLQKAGGQPSRDPCGTCGGHHLLDHSCLAHMRLDDINSQWRERLKVLLQPWMHGNAVGNAMGAMGATGPNKQ